MGNAPEARRSLWPVWGWILLIGLNAFLSACCWFPPLQLRLTGKSLGGAEGVLGFFLAMAGIWLLLRLAGAILERNAGRPSD